MCLDFSRFFVVSEIDQKFLPHYDSQVVSEHQTVTLHRRRKWPMERRKTPVSRLLVVLLSSAHGETSSTLLLKQFGETSSTLLLKQL
ncbi:unnamed protein product [Amoebophrya sp. A25]|nr:unnamed protein product [Amoebophrya sp. A25]|eukprot:GSA25T00009507001.1